MIVINKMSETVANASYKLASVIVRNKKVNIVIKKIF